MLAVSGTYQNGQINLDKEYKSKTPVRVIVTFLEDEEEKNDKKLTLSDFSFAESRKALAHYKGSFSDAVNDERHSDL